MNTKPFYLSKTIIFALIQFIIGVLGVFTATFGDIAPHYVYLAMMGKSLLDVLLRTMTTTSIK